MKTQPSRFSGTCLTAVLALPLALAACGQREEGQTVGQRVDRAIERSEQAARDVGEGGRQAAQDAREATMGAASSAGDAQITSQVKAGLAADKDLSATGIEVDTREGVVTLKGQAPSATAKARAGEIARGVKDVRSVDNQLTVRAG